jgi:hypothetical protein
VGPENYLLYVRKGGKGGEYLTLTAQEAHPRGWRLEKILVALE